MTAQDDELGARAAARIGTVLRGKYRLDRVLGIGGMASVYAATHRNRKEFAVKILHPELSFHADTRTRFLREGYVANSVGHAGTVVVLDDDIAEDGAAFLVMELLDGETVEQLWERSGRRIELEVALKIGRQVLDVLAAAHAKEIVHRDVKPANVFLTRAGELKVLDFGIARLRDVAASHAHATHSGMLLGTPAFMAPEQALANVNEIDARTDVWAVGAMLYTLLTGQLVHEADNAMQILVKAASVPARSLATVLPGTPPAIVHLIDRALAFDKSARWPTAAAMRQAISDASMALSDRTQVIPLYDSLRDVTVVHLKDPALAATLPSEPDVAGAHEAYEDDREQESTEPRKKNPSLHAIDDDEIFDIAPGVPPSSDAPTAVKRAGAEIETMTALYKPKVSRPETVTRFRLPARSRARALARSARNAWSAWSEKLSLATSESLSRETRGKVLRASALVLSLVAGSITFIAVRQAFREYGAHHSPPTAVPETASESPIPAPVATSEAVDAAAAEPALLTELPSTEPPTPIATPPAPLMRPKPAPPAGASIASVVQPPVRPPPKPNCTPPWLIDSTGTQRWKKECLR